jgi:hypothetical protein
MNGAFSLVNLTAVAKHLSGETEKKSIIHVA